jgi:ribosomal protein L31
MSMLRTARPLARLAAPVPSSSRASSTTVNQWKGKSHIRAPPTIPNPLPAIYPQRVVLSDGSTFTAYTTAPTPAILRMTRDVTNNPLWAPGTEKRGLDDGAEDGRVGRFRRRFAGTEAASASAEEGAAPAENKPTFRADDLSWMSEGAEEEKMSARQRAGPVKGKKPKK